MDEALWSHHTRLYRYARHSLSHEDAEDAVSETLYHALKNASHYQEQGTLLAWLFTILRRLLIDNARKRHVITQPLLETDASQLDTANNAIARIELKTILQSPKGKLLALAGVGFSGTEIASASNRNRVTVQCDIWRARRQLQ